MKQLFDYCFYRIALFYKKRMPFEDYIVQGHTLLVSALGFMQLPSSFEIVATISRSAQTM